MKRIAPAMAVLWAGLLSVSGAQAQLVSLGTVVYDEENNITWLQDANLAHTLTFGLTGINADGSMSWTTAQSWIGALNKMNYGGSNQWALPTTLLGDANCSQDPKSASFGYNCFGSQLGDLYYKKLGGTVGSTIILTHNSFYEFFRKFQPYLYWSGTLWTNVKNSAFSSSFGNGWQGTDVYDNDLYVIAVHRVEFLFLGLPIGPSLSSRGTLLQAA